MILYRLKTVRLINFHNFTDAEIEVRGHLFLVGDNATGKTTVLDAVQWVLSGGQDLEFNAAASFWGTKDEARTLKGAVLRQDAERGTLNRGRTVTYAALELEGEKGENLTLGMGAEMAHPEAQLQTWGFIHPGPLSEVRLLKEAGGNGAVRPIGAIQAGSPAAGSGADLRPLTKEELREILGPDRVFLQTGRYKKILSAKLTHGEEAFHRLTWFWKVSKAYKQMAHATTDYSDLLRKLLPEPEGDVFLGVANGLADLALIEDRLRGLREQLGYLAALRQWTEDVQKRLEEKARYEYLLVYKELTAQMQERTRVEEDMRRARLEAEKADREISAARRQAASLEARLQDLRAKDREGLLGRRMSLERDLELARAELENRRRESNQTAMELARLGKKLAQTRRDLSSALKRFADSLEESLASLPGQRATQGLLSALRQAAEDAAPESAWAALDPRAARQEIIASREAAQQKLALIQPARFKAEEDLLRAARLLEELERTPDPLPEIPGYGECLRRLDDCGLKFTPLYRVLEKASDADESLFRDLETALGERILGAVVPEPEDAAEVSRVVLRDFPGVPVVRTDLPVPASGGRWLEGIVAWDRLSSEARGYLLRLAGEDPSPGLRLEGGGRVEQWGARLKVGPRPTPLIGAEARQAAHRRRIQETSRQAAHLKAHRSNLERQEEALKAQAGALETVFGLSAEMREGERLGAERECLEALKDEAAARERQRRAKEDSDKQAVHAQALAQELGAVGARLAAAGLKELENQIVAIEAERSRTEGRCQALDQKIGALRNQQETLDKKLQETESALKDAQSRLDACAQTLGPLIAQDHRRDLARYVLETKKGKLFARVENIQESLEEAKRARIVAATQIQGAGGILHPQYGGLFGLTYDEGANRILDRKEQALEQILENFSNQVAESERLLDEKRRKLFEEVILGDLARRLRSQIADLEETVKGVNALLRRRIFGERTRYQIHFRPRQEHARFVAAVKRLAGYDPASQEEFKAELTERLKVLREGGALPPEFDYRYWFEFHLRMSAYTQEGVLLEPKVARLGSGGEQAVPKYLIILAMASLLFRMSESKVHILLFDEVFYGIDPGRREELLRLATDLDLQLVVASPEQAGDREAYRKATTIFLLKDAEGEVHTVVNHFWVDAPAELFSA